MINRCQMHIADRAISGSSIGFVTLIFMIFTFLIVNISIYECDSFKSEKCYRISERNCIIHTFG